LELPPSKEAFRQLSLDNSHLGGPGITAGGRVPDEHKYKTELCKKWVETGACPYEAKCRFAHGPDEMQTRLIINGKYRSKPCFEFHKNGYCAYGIRCLFYHGERADQRAEEERRGASYVVQMEEPQARVNLVVGKLEDIIVT